MQITKLSKLVTELIWSQQTESKKFPSINHKSGHNKFEPHIEEENLSI